jgi:putative hydrolase of the HAD superfamily
VTRVEAVISDFGGVLTSPLLHSFAAFQDHSGIPLETLGEAMAQVSEVDGANPLFELEKGALTERDFLAKLEAGVESILGRRVAMHDFSEHYFASLSANHELFDHYRMLRDLGIRMAMLTNNVKEWEPRWRSMLPVDEVFEIVVDSAFVGMRKPEPRIYELTVERLGGDLRAQECLFLDDIEVNCDAARGLGMTAVHFRQADQAIAELESALAQ